LAFGDSIRFELLVRKKTVNVLGERKDYEKFAKLYNKNQCKQLLTIQLLLTLQ